MDETTDINGMKEVYRRNPEMMNQVYDACIGADMVLYILLGGFAHHAGHNPDEDSTFISVEKYVDDAVQYLRAHHVYELDAAYGVSMGGSAVMRLLAVQAIPVRKAIIDAGITPYPYPLAIRKLIALKDLAMVSIGTKNEKLAMVFMPPERWTPAGENPDAYYRKVFDFLASKRFSAKTIYNVFWSANNWSCSDPIPESDTFNYGADFRRI